MIQQFSANTDASITASVPYTLITSTSVLSDYCKQWQTIPVLALDTEFIRISTYRPRLCLVQLATPTDIYLIDPMQLDLTCLYEVLACSDCLKILHAGKQDLEIFWNAMGSVPAPIFDTQIAAQFALDIPQIGYAALVQQLLGVTLDKSQARTNWQQRPLFEPQLCYAAHDVAFLHQIYQLLEQLLHKEDQWQVFLQQCRLMENGKNYETQMTSAWKKVKVPTGILKTTRQKQTLKKLAYWREQMAIKLDKPRRWILSDAAIIGVSQHLPQDDSSLRRINCPDPQRLQKHARRVLDFVSQSH